MTAVLWVRHAHQGRTSTSSGSNNLSCRSRRKNSLLYHPRMDRDARGDFIPTRHHHHEGGEEYDRKEIRCSTKLRYSQAIMATP